MRIVAMRRLQRLLTPRRDRNLHLRRRYRCSRRLLLHANSEISRLYYRSAITAQNVIGIVIVRKIRVTTKDRKTIAGHR